MPAGLYNFQQISSAESRSLRRIAGTSSSRGLTTSNDINDLIETGFVQTNTRHTISLHPMIQEIALSETRPSVTSCHTLLDSLQKICLIHGTEVSYYKKLFQTVENVIHLQEASWPQTINRHNFTADMIARRYIGFFPLLGESLYQFNKLEAANLILYYYMTS